MHTVQPVTLTLPDGGERELRFTLGARRRIIDLLGMDMQSALNKYGDSALPEILYALLHDAKGKPPEGLTLEDLREGLPADASAELLAAVMSAATQGKTPKNEYEALMKQIQQAEIEKLIGSISGPSAPSASASATESSGGDTSK